MSKLAFKSGLLVYKQIIWNYFESISLPVKIYFYHIFIDLFFRITWVQFDIFKIWLFRRSENSHTNGLPEKKFPLKLKDFPMVNCPNTKVPFPPRKNPSSDNSPARKITLLQKITPKRKFFLFIVWAIHLNVKKK